MIPLMDQVQLRDDVSLKDFGSVVVLVLLLGSGIEREGEVEFFKAADELPPLCC